MRLKHAAKQVVPKPWWDRMGWAWARFQRRRAGLDRPGLPPAEGPIRLNMGCGTDYREGFINIDGSATLPRVDRVVDFTTEPLLDHFALGSVDHILANDVIEHLFHWEAVDLLAQFVSLLRPGGTVEIRVPDCGWILRSRLSVEQKVKHLYGGQDVPQGRDADMDEARKLYPQHFCHKYGWTQESMRAELERIGLRVAEMRRAGSNFITYAQKPI